jgi:predicted nucleic acid-binding protein
MNKIYLDSCILIAYFSNNKEEKENKKEVRRILKIFEELNAEFYISNWTISEMMNILLSRHKMKNEKVLQFESELLNKSRLGNLKVKILDIEGYKRKYDLKEFLYDIRKNILKYHSGVGDTIHSVIMSNNKIHKIVTFDEKKDFKNIAGLIVLHPRNIRRDMDE